MRLATVRSGGADRPDRGRLGGRGHPGKDRAQDRHHQEKGRKKGAGDLAQQDGRGQGRHFGLGDFGRPIGPDPHRQQHVDDVKHYQQESGQDRAHEKVPDRHADNVADQHQHDAGGNDLPQGTGCRHGSGGQLLVVASFQHGGDRQQAHGDHGGAHDARGGAQQGAHHDYGYRQSAADAPEDQAHGVQQLFGKARALQHNPHENEKRHRQQGDVGHDAPDPQGEEVEKRPAETDQAEKKGGAEQGEGDRKAGHQENRQGEKHPAG